MPLSFWGDIGKWAGGLLSPPTSSSVTGQEVAPIIRSIPRKYSQVLTTDLLPASATYTSPWFDTNQTGDTWVRALAFANPGCTNGFRIEETNDPGIPTILQNITATANNNAFGSSSSVIASTLTPIYGTIRARYWRVRYTNDAVSQTIFSLSVTSSSIFTVPSLNSGTVAGLQPIFVSAIGAGTSADGGSTGSMGIAGQSPAVVTGGVTSGGNNAAIRLFRIPNTFKTATAVNAGNTAVWTPGAGLKFRLMRYQIELTENATLAVAAVVTVKFQDNVTDFGFQHDQFIPAAAGVATGEAWRSGWIDMGNGYISTVANNVLNFNIGGGANLTGGQFRINVCGTEE